MDPRGLFESSLNYAKCKFITLPKVYRKYNSGFALQKNSELTPLFNYHIGKLRERGQINKVIEKFMPVHDESSCSRSGPSAIQLPSVISLCSLCWPWGCVAALGVAAVERVFMAVRARRERLKMEAKLRRKHATPSMGEKSRRIDLTAFEAK